MDTPLQCRLREKHWSMKELRKAARIMRTVPSSRSLRFLHHLTEHIVILSGILISVCALLVLFPLFLVAENAFGTVVVVALGCLSGLLYGPFVKGSFDVGRSYHLVLMGFVLLCVATVTYLLFSLFASATAKLGFDVTRNPLLLTIIFTIPYVGVTVSFLMQGLRCGYRRLVP